MRTLLAAMLAAAALAAAAQSAPRPLPPGSVPLQDAPPPPVIQGDNSDPQPEITTRQEGDNHVVEYRVKGKLYMQRVTPKGGRPYVLMDHKGDGTFMRQDNPLDNGVRVPQWVLKEF